MSGHVPNMRCDARDPESRVGVPQSGPKAQRRTSGERGASSLRRISVSAALFAGFLPLLLPTSSFGQQAERTIYPQFMAAPNPASDRVELRSIAPENDGRLRVFIEAIESIGGLDLVKGEFESTAQYEVRITAFRKNVVLGLRLSDSIAFAVSMNTLNLG
jgi:hypothetical protein